MDSPGVVRVAAPNAIELRRRAAALGVPGAAIPLQDRALVADSPDVVSVASLYASETIAFWQRILPNPGAISGADALCRDFMALFLCENGYGWIES